MTKTSRNHVATRVATAATVGYEHSRAKDLLGRVYEYFPSPLASAQGKKGGESAFILANPPFTILDWGGPPARRQALAVRRPAGGRRQLRVDATHHASQRR